MPKPGGLFDKSNLLLGTEACGDGHGDMRNAGGMHAKMMRNLKKKPGPPPEGGLSYDDFVKQEAAKKIQKGYKESPRRRRRNRRTGVPVQRSLDAEAALCPMAAARRGHIPECGSCLRRRRRHPTTRRAGRSASAAKCEFTAGGGGLPLIQPVSRARLLVARGECSLMAIDCPPHQCSASSGAR